MPIPDPHLLSKSTIYALLLVFEWVLIPATTFGAQQLEGQSDENMLPILVYDEEVQQLARKLMKPGLFTRGQFRTLRQRMDKWVNLAQRCNDSSNTGDTEEFYSAACHTFAHAFRIKKTNAHEHTCNNLRG